MWGNINKLLGKRKKKQHLTNDGQAVANALADEYQSKSADSNYPAKFLKKHKSDLHTITKTYRQNLHKRYKVEFSIVWWALDRKGGSSTGADNISYC